MDKETLLIELKSKTELLPDTHDGSYELVREVINSYATLDSFDDVTYADLDAVYLMAIITKRINPEKKKEKIKNTCLPEEEKDRLIQIIDKVWDNACLGTFYSNKEPGGAPVVGMFGTDFMSFKGKTTEDCAKRFIEMCVEISKEDDADIIYSKAEKVVNASFKGMKAASASIVLHCLKPDVFPIMNGNQGMGNIFSMLGIDLEKPTDIGSYISNCRKINTFRNAELPFKNYRIFDLIARDIFGKDIDDINEDNEETITNFEVSFDHNLILYGPPGTGKTYNSVVYAVAIIEGKSVELVQDEAKLNYADVKARYDEYKEMGQIAFTTFHQSYGYEEFIEGIRPVLDSKQKEDNQQNGDIGYEIKSGVFREFCEIANRSSIIDEDVDLGINRNPVVWKVSLEGSGDNETRNECMENNHIRIGWDEYGQELSEETQYENGGKAILDAFINQMRIGDLVLSCYNKNETDAIGVITGDYVWDDKYTYYRRVRAVKWLVKGIRENILKINNGASLTLAAVYKMKIQAADLLEIVKKYTVKKETANNKNFVFIIDEINRGNISKIFGELITLIETTKRLGKDEEVRVKLPYSGVEFGVPDNVYILGTMNTADRSIALMDTALRRRFSFIEMMPQPEVLTNLGITTMKKGAVSLDIPQMLSVINKRVEFLFDREHTIGHAFFTGLKGNENLDKLGEIFKKNVIPLLQEYFYEDYEKIQLVLGDNKKTKDDYKFILKAEESASSIFNGNPELDAMSVYKVNSEAFKHLESYVEIYEKTGE